MIYKNLILIVVFVTQSFGHLQAQLASDYDESKLYAETKQVNQFFRRFNGEEDENGKRYYAKDKDYRDSKLRKQYISILFDHNNEGIRDELKVAFAREVLDKRNPKFLDFHDNNWFAEVNTTFQHRGKEIPVVLFMQLEQQHLGSKWVINKVFANQFAGYFSRDTTQSTNFLHPLSHELDFMNLRKAFDSKDNATEYTIKDFKPDHLSVFIYAIRNGDLKFKTINSVHFHVFQIEGWYFELSEFNREGYNTGWLISNLVESDAEQQLLLKQYILNEN